MKADHAVKSDLRYFLAQYNASRIRNGEKPITLRQISRDTGIAISTLMLLNTGASKGIQFDTLGTLCDYLDCGPSDLLRRAPSAELGRSRDSSTATDVAGEWG
jgi:DNA-binding Xre family transcriptional regulator